MSLVGNHYTQYVMQQFIYFSVPVCGKPPADRSLPQAVGPRWRRHRPLAVTFPRRCHLHVGDDYLTAAASARSARGLCRSRHNQQHFDCRPSGVGRRFGLHGGNQKPQGSRTGALLKPAHRLFPETKAFENYTYSVYSANANACSSFEQNLLFVRCLGHERTHLR